MLKSLRGFNVSNFPASVGPILSMPRTEVSPLRMDTKHLPFLEKAIVLRRSYSTTRPPPHPSKLECSALAHQPTRVILHILLISCKLTQTVHENHRWSATSPIIGNRRSILGRLDFHGRQMGIFHFFSLHHGPISSDITPDIQLRYSWLIVFSEPLLIDLYRRRRFAAKASASGVGPIKSQNTWLSV